MCYVMDDVRCYYFHRPYPLESAGLRYKHEEKVYVSLMLGNMPSVPKYYQNDGPREMALHFL
jgi:hypothetical protein